MKTEVAIAEEGGVEPRTEATGEGISIEEVELREPGVNDVHIDMKACGICHSDWHVATGDNMMDHYPCALGHEGAGVVQDTGEAVEHVEPGDHVALTWMPACGKCEACSRGEQELCTRGANMMQGPQPNGEYYMHKSDGTDVSQYAFLGCFAEEVVVPKDSVVPVPEDIDHTTAALVGCGAATGFGSSWNRADFGPGATVVHYGLGGVGAASVMASASQGANEIIVVEPVEEKREMASEFGATHTVDPESQQPAEFVRSLTDGRMADAAIITKDVGFAEDYGDAMSTIRSGGDVIGTSSPPMTLEDIEIPLEGGGVFGFMMSQKNLKGSLYGGWAPNYAIPKMLKMHQSGTLDLEKLVSQTYDLDELVDGYRDMLGGNNIRGVVDLT
jgi:S-(hydroxymethyl)glutathione dehydrogenase/alcohol dehydrogenase